MHFPLPTWALFVIFWLVSSAMRALPTPTVSTNQFYLFFYTFVHAAAANWDLAQTTVTKFQAQSAIKAIKAHLKLVHQTASIPVVNIVNTPAPIPVLLHEDEASDEDPAHPVLNDTPSGFTTLPPPPTVPPAAF